MCRKDGSTLWVALSASLVRDELGDPGYVIAQFQDIDDRKRSERLMREAEARFRTAFEDAAVPMVLLDMGMVVHSANAAMARMLDTSEAELVGRKALDLVDPADRGPIRAELIELGGEALERYERELRWVRDDGTLVLAVLRAALLRDDDGHPTYWVGQFQDVTAEREATRNAQLRLAQQTAVAWLGQRALAEDDLQSLFDAAPMSLASTCEAPYTALALRDGDGLRLTSGSGWPATRPGQPRSARVPGGLHRTRGAPVIVEDFAVEHRFDGSMLTAYGMASGMSVTVAGESGEHYGVLSVHATEPHAFTTDDIAFLASVANVLTGAIRRAAAARDLRHQSLHDPLTQLPNRALMLDRLRQGIARSRRDGSTLAVLFLDMDDFKYVNDTLGHEAGDRLLAQLALRLRGALRTTDTLARFGGDEFVMLCEGLSDPAEVIAVADRVLAGAPSRSTWVARSSCRPRRSGSRWPTPALPPTPRRCCATPTSPCTGPRRAGRGATSCSTRRCANRRSSASACSATCAVPWPATSCASSTSRWCRCTAARWRASRRSCAGSTPSAACCCPTTSSSWPRTPA